MYDCNGKGNVYFGCCFVSLQLDQSCFLFSHKFYVIYFARDECVPQSVLLGMNVCCMT